MSEAGAPRGAERVASIDVGSNSVLMLVAERVGEGPWARVEDAAEVTRISEGLDASGSLAPAAVERTLAQLRRYVARARELGVARFVATGTAPFRRADNGADVARMLGRELGLRLDVVSGEREAELSQIATRDAFPELDAMTILDIGGASTEVIALPRGGAAEVISLDVGAVRLGERFGTAAALDAPAADALRQAVAEAIRPAAHLLAPGRPVIGIAGTVTTLATAAMGLDVGRRARAWLPPARRRGAAPARRARADARGGARRAARRAGQAGGRAPRGGRAARCAARGRRRLRGHRQRSRRALGPAGRV